MPTPKYFYRCPQCQRTSVYVTRSGVSSIKGDILKCRWTSRVTGEKCGWSRFVNETNESKQEALLYSNFLRFNPRYAKGNA